MRVPVALTYGLFHLRNSLLPGLGLPLLVLGILGLAAPWLAPSERRQPLLVIAGFALLWYAVHELSPLKPFPGYVRYMLPLAPLLIILGAAFVYELTRRLAAIGGFALIGAAMSGLVAAAIVLTAAAPALILSLRINGPMTEDPRALRSRDRPQQRAADGLRSLHALPRRRRRAIGRGWAADCGNGAHLRDLKLRLRSVHSIWRSARAAGSHARQGRLLHRAVQAAFSRGDEWPAELCLLQSGHTNCRAGWRWKSTGAHRRGAAEQRSEPEHPLRQHRALGQRLAHGRVRSKQQLLRLGQEIGVAHEQPAPVLLLA